MILRTVATRSVFRFAVLAALLLVFGPAGCGGSNTPATTAGGTASATTAGGSTATTSAGSDGSSSGSAVQVPGMAWTVIVQ